MQNATRVGVSLLLALTLCVATFAFPDNVSAATKKPAKVAGVSVTRYGDTGIKAKWKKAKRAKQYQVAYKTKAASKWKYAKTKKRTYSKINLKENTVYQVKVRALNGKKKGKWSKTTSVTTETYVAQVLKIMNKERASRGLPAYSLNTYMVNAVNTRSIEISVFFSHTRPNGQSCISACPYLMHGENIAMGQTTPTQVMSSWMNSSGHRANILSNEFKSAAIGHYYKGGYHYWVQIFSYYTTEESGNVI